MENIKIATFEEVQNYFLSRGFTEKEEGEDILFHKDLENYSDGFLLISIPESECGYELHRVNLRKTKKGITVGAGTVSVYHGVFIKNNDLYSIDLFAYSKSWTL